MEVAQRGSPRVAFRLREEDLSVLRTIVASEATLSDVIRQREIAAKLKEAALRGGAQWPISRFGGA